MGISRSRWKDLFKEISNIVRRYGLNLFCGDPELRYRVF